VARDPSSPTAQQSRRIRRPSEIEFFNRIGRVRAFATVSYPVGRDDRQVSDETSNTETGSSRPTSDLRSPWERSFEGFGVIEQNQGDKQASRRKESINF